MPYRQQGRIFQTPLNLIKMWEGPNYQPNLTPGNTWDFINTCDGMFVITFTWFMHIQVVLSPIYCLCNVKKWINVHRWKFCSRAAASFLLQPQQEKLPHLTLQGPPPREIEFPCLFSPRSACWQCQHQLQFVSAERSPLQHQGLLPRDEEVGLLWVMFWGVSSLL